MTDRWYESKRGNGAERPSNFDSLAEALRRSTADAPLRSDDSDPNRHANILSGELPNVDDTLSLLLRAVESASIAETDSTIKAETQTLGQKPAEPNLGAAKVSQIDLAADVPPSLKTKADPATVSEADPPVISRSRKRSTTPRKPRKAPFVAPEPVFEPLPADEQATHRQFAGSQNGDVAASIVQPGNGSKLKPAALDGTDLGFSAPPQQTPVAATAVAGSTAAMSAATSPLVHPVPSPDLVPVPPKAADTVPTATSAKTQPVPPLEDWSIGEGSEAKTRARRVIPPVEEPAQPAAKAKSELPPPAPVMPVIRPLAEVLSSAPPVRLAPVARAVPANPPANVAKLPSNPVPPASTDGERRGPVLAPAKPTPSTQSQPMANAGNHNPVAPVRLPLGMPRLATTAPSRNAPPKPAPTTRPKNGGRRFGISLKAVSGLLDRVEVWLEKTLVDQQPPSELARTPKWDRRRGDRISKPALVAFYWTGDRPQPRPVSNISHSGVYVVTTDHWYPGTRLCVTLQKSDVEKGVPGSSIAVDCEVVRMGDDGVGFVFMTGKNDPLHGQHRPVARKHEVDLFVKGLAVLQGHKVVTM